MVPVFLHEYLITGGCGVIGSNFVRFMLERYKRGRVVPVKFQLWNPDGTAAAGATVRLKIVKISSSVLGTVEEEIDHATVGSANTDNLFRYDATGHQFIYNLATSALNAGTYRLEILPDDGSAPHRADLSQGLTRANT